MIRDKVQKDDSECGVYVTQYMNFVAQNLDPNLIETIERKDQMLHRNRLAWELVRQEFLPVVQSDDQVSEEGLHDSEHSDLDSLDLPWPEEEENDVEDAPRQEDQEQRTRNSRKRSNRQRQTRSRNNAERMLAEVMKIYPKLSKGDILREVRGARPRTRSKTNRQKRVRKKPERFIPNYFNILGFY